MEPSPNRRASRRLPPRGAVKVKCRKGALDLGDNLCRSTLDLSETGARLALKQALTAGQEVMLTLESATSGRRVLRLATVAWCATGSDGSVSAGFRFDKPLAYTDLDHLAKS
jgi:hypothetical protein